MNRHGSYKLEILKKSPEDLYEYAKFVLEHVDEVEKRTIQEEIKKIQSQYHIDHYFILKKSERVGVVKIYQSTYYYLGLVDEVPEDDIPKIMGLIEDNLGGWRINRIEATLHKRFKEYAVNNGYKIEFARIKMELSMKDVSNLAEQNIELRTYERGDLTHLIDMASDAYRDSVDEQIGVFSGGMASSAISSILRGNFGEFKSDLTPIYIQNNNSNYIEGASMTTISEGCPFVVLIGVRRAEQGKGIGRVLLSWVIRKTRDLGYDKLRLWVTKGNENALALYKSLGFREISRIYSLYKEF